MTPSSSSSFGFILVVVIVATIQTLWINQLLLHRQQLLQDQLKVSTENDTRISLAKKKTNDKGFLLRQTFVSTTKTTTNKGSGAPPPTKKKLTTTLSFQPSNTYQQQQEEEIVGTFNNHTLTWFDFSDKNKQFASTMHCVGDIFDKTKSWMYQSCEFSNLCFDLSEKNFVYVSTEQQRQLQSRVKTLNQNVQPFEEWDPSMKKFGHEMKRPITISTLIDSFQHTVSLGGLNINWDEKRQEALEELEENDDTDEKQRAEKVKNITQGLDALKWFPHVLTQGEFYQKSSKGVYMLPSDKVLIPFHSFGGMNVGHLLWDDFLPLFSLMSIFGFSDKEPILLRQAILEGEPKALWATCDLRKQSRQRCDNFYNKFLSLMNTSFDKYSTTDDFRLEVATSRRQSRYVCASHAVAGMGMLTDHALKKHGWNPQDYWTSHNFLKGQQLWNFRNHMMKNLGFTKKDIYRDILKSSSTNKKIIISRMSSKSDVRRSSYENELRALEQEFHSDDSVNIESTILLYHSAYDQINMVKDASIFITSAGGGAVTGMFLPRGASVIVYYDEGSESTTGDEKDFNNNIVEAGHLDWDYWNHVGYLRIHWLPIRRLSDNTQLLVELVKEELTFMEQQY